MALQHVINVTGNKTGAMSIDNEQIQVKIAEIS